MANSKNQEGYILLAVMLLMTLLLITLSLELPRISQQIKRSKEEELVHRGEQYKMAIKRFVRKNGRYPASLEQLETANNMRFLRKRYKDPITGKDEWKLLHVGEVQLNAANGQLNAAGQGGNNIFGAPGSLGNPGGNSGSPGAPATGSTGGSTGTPTVGPANSPGPGSGSFGVGNVQFGGAGIIGVSSTSKEKSIKELNGKDHYNEWLFVYDPRLDAPRVGSPGGFGTPGGINPPPPGSNPPGNPPGGPVPK